MPAKWTEPKAGTTRAIARITLDHSVIMNTEVTVEVVGIKTEHFATIAQALEFDGLGDEGEAITAELGAEGEFFRWIDFPK
jgi:hypothetical protein